MKSMCVFCGSKMGKNPLLQKGAIQFAGVLLEKNISLVYGGAQSGLMGLIANHVLRGGGRVIGVMPESLMSMEYAHQNLSEFHLVDSMSDRKIKMAELSDAFITLPGGIGTLDELFEVWTWKHIGIHNKPVGLLNTENFYDSLITHIERMTSEGFLSINTKESLIIEADPKILVEKLLGSL